MTECRWRSSVDECQRRKFSAQNPEDMLKLGWMDEETFSFGNCSGIFGRAQDGSRWVERCLWVDPNHEVNWSLAVFTADPGSLDIVVIAEKICLSDNAGISD